jgi:hypothetical protein
VEKGNKSLAKGKMRGIRTKHQEEMGGKKRGCRREGVGGAGLKGRRERKTEAGRDGN